MAASKEERIFRSSNKKCVMGEAKYRLLQDLVKKKTGLREVEEFVIIEIPETLHLTRPSKILYVF